MNLLLKEDETHLNPTISDINLNCEELLSCMEIQTRSLQGYSKEILDNIGQVLNLVRMQLLSFDPGGKNNTGDITFYGQLVGQAVKDLRRLTRQLQPEKIAENGLLSSITDELDRMKESGLCTPVFRLRGRPRPVSRMTSLVLFAVLQRLMAVFVSAEKRNPLYFSVRYTERNVYINLSGKYRPEKLFLIREEWAAIERKIGLIGGRIVYNTGKTFRFRISFHTYGNNSTGG